MKFPYMVGERCATNLTEQDVSAIILNSLKVEGLGWGFNQRVNRIAGSFLSVFSCLNDGSFLSTYF